MPSPAFPGSLTPGDPDLSQRQRAVFAAVLAVHGREARPVSSARIARSGDLRLSGASVRSAMADLEDMGLLERAHASAGRQPSARGWEFFVRTLLEPAVLPAEVEDAIHERLSQSTHDVELLLHDASRLLASLTRQMGLALAMSLDDERLTALDLEPLGERRALLALGLSGRETRALVLELDSPLERGELAEVEGVLRERLLHRPLLEVRERLAQDPALARHSAVRIVARAAQASWSRPVGTPLLSAGAGHMAQQPEFARTLDLASLLRAIEAGAPLDRLMLDGLHGHAGVRVGVHEARALLSCSLVSFSLPGAIPGAVGVLGPMRMDYAFTLAVVDRVGSRVAELLSA